MATRRFSVEDDFMNYKTNDLLYGFMRGLSTARPVYVDGKETWREYLPQKIFKKNKKTIASICGVTMTTIGNQLNKLIEAGLVEEGMEVLNDTETAVYWFPYNKDENYKLIEQDIVKYLVDTRSPQAIRVYLYLLNKFQWKKDYVFTIREIKLALGYSESTKSAESTIKNILASFNKEGMITYEKFLEDEDVGDENTVKVVPVERMKLKNVVCASADLPIF